jgi:hypothetical protein
MNVQPKNKFTINVGAWFRTPLAYVTSVGTKYNRHAAVRTRAAVPQSASGSCGAAGATDRIGAATGISVVIGMQ